MVTTYILIAGIAMFIGIIVGVLISRTKKSYDGVFKVDMTDPNKDIFTVELFCPIGEIPTKRYMAFMVENVSSQEKPFV